MREIHRILDANFNRAREALRVAEDCGRFALNDPAVTATAKYMRSELQEIYTQMPVQEMLVSRDTPGDIGTEITSPTEPIRKDLLDVATASLKRLGEALRSIEEYSKIVAPKLTPQIERMRYNAYTLEQRLVSRVLVARRFSTVKLYVLMTPELCKGSVREIARGAIAGGADAIQLRVKGEMPDAQHLALAAELRELTDETGKLLIINDRADIAAIIGADGVHLGQKDLPIAEVRRLQRPGAIIGRSSNNLDQTRAALNEGADYISVGPMYPTTTKDRPVAGVGLLEQAVKEIPIPLCAIGGVTAANAGDLIAKGASCVAVSSAICTAENAKAAAEEIVKAIRAAGK